MIILSWNLNSTYCQKDIHDLIAIHSLDVFCVQETKVSIEVMHQYAPRIWFAGHCQSIGLQGNSRGLALFWDPWKISPHLWISSHSSISMVDTTLDSSETILVTNFCAPIDICWKIHLWDHVRYVCSCAPYFPLILGGNFNSILSLEEKRGGWPRLSPASDLFQAQLDVLSIIDVKPSNGLFTWNNRWSGQEAISKCLDRFLVSCCWVGGGLIMSSEILDWRGSNHWPIKFSSSPIALPKNPSFRFQLMWLIDSSLYDLVAKWWIEGGPAYGMTMFIFEKKLKYVKYHLKRWNTSFFGNLQSRKRNALDHLAMITCQIRDSRLIEALDREDS